MKSIFTIVILSALCFVSTIQAKIIQEGVYIFDKNKSKLSTFKSQKDLTIDLVTNEGYEVYGPKGLIRWVNTLGVNKIIIEDGKEKTALENKTFASYPTFLQVETKLKELVKKYPHILSMFSIGKSVENRDLWVIKISDNVAVDETEPEFKYIANMHGDEIVGRDLLVSLIEDLATDYANGSSRAKEIIDNTEIFIIPSMNPDGMTKKRRSNANWVDLNRDFPDFSWPSNSTNTTDGRAKETALVMDFQKNRNFALSANFHGGATVVNYPWDTIKDPAPLTPLIVELSKEYASIVPGMFNSHSFEDGIINGYEWYEVNGGMQDWSYFWHNDLQLTMEVSDIKWPNFSAQPQFYKDNKESMIRLIERIHQGGGFKFLNPLITQGSVEIRDLKDDKYLGKFIFSTGEFYKVLPIGNYKFDVTTIDNNQYSLEIVVDSSINNLKYQLIK